MTSAERVLKSTVKGFQPVDQVLNTLRNKIPPTEWQILKDAGIEEAFGPAQRVDAQEVQKWIDENGPRVEVRKFGATKEVEKPATRRRLDIVHEMDTRFRNQFTYDTSGDVTAMVLKPNGSRTSISRACLRVRT